jgi:hypothetical protein
MAKQRDEFRGPQCRYVTRRAFSMGYHACGRYAGHDGPHVSVYELTWVWMTREEYAARYGTPEAFVAQQRLRPVVKAKKKKAKR